MRIFERSLRNLLKDLAKIFAKILQDLQGFDHDLAKILGKILTESFLGSFKILEDSIRIFERSLRNLLKDLAKIFVKILQDLQGFDQDLAKILGKILTVSLLGSFKILEDSMRIFERSLRNLLKDLSKIFVKILQVFKDLIKILQRSLVRSKQDLCYSVGSFKILDDSMRIFESSDLADVC